MSEQSKPRVFLCYASDDKPQVAELYQKLKAAGYHPWLDKYDLLPGQNWRREIQEIITDPYNLVLICLSSKSVSKRGVVQQEIEWALDILDQMPEDRIYLIPVRLEDCQTPDRLTDVHWINLFEDDGFEYLTRAIDFELSQREVATPSEPATPPQILSPSQPFEPELILVPAGEFLMGSDPRLDQDAGDDEQSQHRLYLPNYYMAKTPVTNAQYTAFIKATGRQTAAATQGWGYVWKGEEWEKIEGANWQHPQGPNRDITGKSDHPVVQVSWHDAVDYCKWLAGVTGRAYRLPSEAEWEKAARGTDGRIYPWGNEWDPTRCNTVESGQQGTTPVGAFPNGASSYGLLDMTGNVWEWTLSLWGKEVINPDFKYPYEAEDGREEIDASDEFLRVVRGGSFYCYGVVVHCAIRNRNDPNLRFNNRGFRIVVAPALPFLPSEALASRTPENG